MQKLPTLTGKKGLVILLMLFLAAPAQSGILEEGEVSQTPQVDWYRLKGVGVVSEAALMTWPRCTSWRKLRGVRCVDEVMRCLIETPTYAGCDPEGKSPLKYIRKSRRPPPDY